RLAGDERRTGNGRRHNTRSAIYPAIRGREPAPEDALLDPRLAFAQLSVRREARELGAGAGSAGGAVVGVAGAEYEAAGAGVAGGGQGEELDVVHFGKALRIHGAADAAGDIGQAGDVCEFQ